MISDKNILFSISSHRTTNYKHLWMIFSKVSSMFIILPLFKSNAKFKNSLILLKANS